MKDSLENLQFPLPASPDYQLADITKTHYDFPNEDIANELEQEYLRTRVSWTEVIDKNATDTIRTYYSYDIHGNVNSLIQNIPGLGPKRTDYTYDLISGNVNHVFYQYGKPDEFSHRYTYDEDNRITKVETSSDRFIWNTDAEYTYYLHGPLARVVLGEFTVQGLDYYYTLQGWLKGVNSPYAAISNYQTFKVRKEICRSCRPLPDPGGRIKKPDPEIPPVAISDSFGYIWIQYGYI